jgi:membrane-bound lytic murein transglycosylase A
LGRKADSKDTAAPGVFAGLFGAWLGVAAAGCLLVGLAVTAAEARQEGRQSSHDHHHHEIGKRGPVIWPLEIPGGQYAPLKWSEVVGWSDDDPLPAFKTFRTSCKPIAAQKGPLADSKALGTSLRDPCIAARAEDISDSVKARAFFEKNFTPLQISRIGEDAGFVTGYYEPIVDGSRVQTDVYNVPVYRRPSNLFVRGYSQANASMPNKGQVFRKIGRRKLVPYYDRAEIEDGAIAGRGLEVVWLKSQTDLLFIQIQGSARIKLEDGSMVRINYDAHNGYPYTPVGRVLIERNIVPKEQMSMQKDPRIHGAESGRCEGIAPVQSLLCIFPRGQAGRGRRGRRRAGRAVDGGTIHCRRQVTACLWHAVFHRRQSADRIGYLEHTVSQADDRTGHGFGDYRSGPC